jgi:dinuclear metal center YbgI/SA1388 family protein
MKKNELLAALADKLSVAAFDDVSNNGLQVDSRRDDLARVCTGVDATLPLLEAAAAWGADLVVCHHGISWGGSFRYVSGLNYEIVRFLMDHDMALWACHLPLDAHPALGNNAGLCDALGLVGRAPFGLVRGRAIGFAGRLPAPLARDAFAALLREKVGRHLHAAPFGGERIETVGVVSGAGADMVDQAIDAGLDAYVTGDLGLVSYNLCLQRRMNLFAVGHYATERFGVRALGDWMAHAFGLAHRFVDFDLPW